MKPLPWLVDDVEAEEVLVFGAVLLGLLLMLEVLLPPLVLVAVAVADSGVRLFWFNALPSPLTMARRVWATFTASAFFR